MIVSPPGSRSDGGAVDGSEGRELAETLTHLARARPGVRVPLGVEPIHQIGDAQVEGLSR
jgi:hypothetical protein